MQKLPPDSRQVGAGGDGRHELDRPLLRLAVGQPFEDAIFEPSEHLGNAEARFVLAVLSGVDRAADSTPLTVFPVVPLYDLVGFGVGTQLLEDARLLFLLPMKRNHYCRFPF